MKESDFNIERVKDEALIKYMGRRVIVLYAGTFQQLTKSIQDQLGTEAKGILFDAGIFSGKQSTNTLLNSWKERGDAFLKKWIDFYSSAGLGWFKIIDINVDLEKGNGKITIQQSFASEKDGIGSDLTSLINDNNPICDFIAGFFVGVFEVLTNKEIDCEEVRDATEEYPYCEFKLVSY